MTSQAGPQTRRVDASSSVLPAVSAFLLSLWLAYIPVNVFTGDLDNSWRSTLTYAHHHGLQWGSDIVFTYGPLGWLFVHDADPSTAKARLLAGWLSCLLISTGACLVAWRMNTVWRTIFLAFLVLSPFAAVSKELVLTLGLVFWALLSLDSHGLASWFYAGVLACGAALLGLVKFTLLVVALLMVMAVVLDCFLRKDKRSAAIVALLFCGVYLAGWLALGQRLSGVMPNLRNGLELARGYDLTMCNPGAREVRIGGILVGILFLGSTASRAWVKFRRDQVWPASRMAVLVGLVIALTFLSWKHGYVRVDTHIIMFVGFASIAGLALEALPKTPPTAENQLPGMGPTSFAWLLTAARIDSIATCLLACVTLHWIAPSMFEGRLEQAFSRVSGNLRALLVPSGYEREIANVQAGALKRYELPKLRNLVGTNAVDLFGQNQIYAILNGLQLRPRPVFQSYCAYTPYLASLNERFYAGTTSPDYVLFDLVPLDQRLPALEDSKVLRRLLTEYQFVDSEGSFLLLKRGRTGVPPLRLQRDGTARLGEKIALPALTDSDLWMQIELKASIGGKLRQFFYQPPKVYLSCHTNTATEGEKFEAPTPMLANGFIISPLLHNRADVQHYLEGRRLLGTAAVSVEVAHRDETFYCQLFHYSIFEFPHHH